MVSTSLDNLDISFPWQNAILQRFQKFIHNDRLAHAYLIFGKEGLGKFQLVQSIAARIFCEQPKNELACGRCHACKLMQQNQHPDYYLLTPAETGKSIAIDQIRLMIKKLAQTAHSASYKIAIINPAEAMTASSMNALLKTLEEPLGQTILFLISTNPWRLPETLKSRCQQLNLEVTDPAQARDFLVQAGVPNEHIASALYDADNAPLLALNRWQSGELANKIELKKQLFSGSIFQPMSLAEQFKSLTLSMVLGCVRSCALDLLKAKLGIAKDYWQNGQFDDEIIALSKRVSLVKLYSLFDELNTNEQLIQMNLNQQLAMEKLFVLWERLFH